MRRKYLILGGAVATLLVLAAVFQQQATHFFWKYFVGPVFADAQNQATAVYNGVVAQRGYNIINEVVYAGAIGLSVFGFYRFLQNRDIGTDGRFVFSFVPFIVFGGLLRVVEDTGVVPFPERVFLVSPVGYALVVLLAFATFYTVLRMVDRGVFDSYERPVAVTGAVLAAFPFTFLLLYGLRNGFESPLLLLWVPLGLVAAALGLQWYVKRFRPESFLDSRVGSLATVSHALDGAVTAVSIAFLGYGEKHPLSEWVMQATGSPFGFYVVKVAFILSVLAAVDRNEDRRFTLLVLLGEVCSVL